MLRIHENMLRSYCLGRSFSCRSILRTGAQRGTTHMYHSNTSNMHISDAAIIEHPQLNYNYHPLVVRVFNYMQRNATFSTSRSRHSTVYDDRKRTALLQKLRNISGDQVRSINAKLSKRPYQLLDTLRKQGGTRAVEVAALKNMGPKEWGNMCTDLTVIMPMQAETWNILDSTILGSVRRDMKVLQGWSEVNADSRAKTEADRVRVMLLDSLLLRANCIKTAREYYGLETGTGNYKNVSTYVRLNGACMADLPLAVVDALSKIKQKDLSLILQSGFAWSDGKKSLKSASELTADSLTEKTEKSNNVAVQVEEQETTESYVSPYAAMQNTTKASAVFNSHAHTSDIDTNNADPLPAMERCALFLDVVNWGERHGSLIKGVQHLRETACESWVKLALECQNNNVQVPLQTLALTWEVLANLEVNHRAGMGRSSLETMQGDTVVARGAFSPKVVPSIPPLSVDLSISKTSMPSLGSKKSSEHAYYHTLFQLVSSSLEKMPYQLSYRKSPAHLKYISSGGTDLKVLQSLLQCMINTGIKSSELLKQIIDICERNSYFQLNATGTLRIFDLLVRLKEPSLARELMRYYFHICSEGTGPNQLIENFQMSGESLKVLQSFFTFRVNELTSASEEPTEQASAILPGRGQNARLAIAETQKTHETIRLEQNGKPTSPATHAEASSVVVQHGVRFSSSELMLALSAFTRLYFYGGNWDSLYRPGIVNVQDHFKVLLKIENNVKSTLQERLNNPSEASLQQWSIDNCIKVLACYAQVGRKQPVVLDMLNQILEQAFLDSEETGQTQFSTANMVMIIWSNAKLNNSPKFFNQMSQSLMKGYFDAAEKLKADPSSFQKMKFINTRQLITAMWSLSVLEGLSVAQYDKLQLLLKALLQKTVSRDNNNGNGNGKKNEYFLNSFERTSLDQISLDQQLLRGEFVPSAGRNMLDNEVYSNKKSGEISFSALQKDISNTLKAMGVSHVYEHMLNNGYTADVFIRPEVDLSHFMFTPGEEPLADYSRHCESLGTVIEIDGPFHFETYMQRPMGSTAMKHRHVRQSGYNFISVPYWVWNANAMSRKEKSNILSKMLRESCTPTPEDKLMMMNSEGER